VKILVDTDVLIALTKSDDSNHDKALKLIGRFKRAEIFLSPFAIPEAVTVLSHKVSQESAVKFLRGIRTKQISQVPYSSELQSKTEKLFLEQKNQRTSWADCCNAAIMQSGELDSLASFDRFYQKFKFKVLP